MVFFSLVKRYDRTFVTELKTVETYPQEFSEWMIIMQDIGCLFLSELQAFWNIRFFPKLLHLNICNINIIWLIMYLFICNVCIYIYSSNFSAKNLFLLYKIELNISYFIALHKVLSFPSNLSSANFHTIYPEYWGIILNNIIVWKILLP
jgi:hypothetical protein